MSQHQDQNPTRPGKITSKKGNPYQGDLCALFLGQETPEEKLRKQLAEQWDRDHPDGDSLTADGKGVG